MCNILIMHEHNTEQGPDEYLFPNENPENFNYISF